MLLLLVGLYAFLLLVAAGLALWKRQRWLLAACAAVAIGWLLTNLLIVPQKGWIHHVQWGVLFADVLVLIAFSVIAAVHRCWWSLGVGAIQLTAVTVHLAYIVQPMLWGSAYAGTEQVLGWLVLLTLTAGAAVARR